MYRDLLTMSYEEAREREDLQFTVNTTRKIITFTNTPELNCYGESSDVMVYYDVINNGPPLLVVERISKCECKYRRLKREVCKIKKQVESCGYVINVSASPTGGYYDIILVNKNVYANLKGI